MSDYELALVTSDDLPEKDKKELLDAIEKKIAEGKGKVNKIDEWEKKNLAYPIEKKETANFTFVEFEAGSTVPAEVRKLLNLSEDVLRSLLIKNEAKKAHNGSKRRRAKKTKED
jgi:small subunit ribosomal protein S6